ncbi:MJ0042-type zinc finger domain-containing protein [Streptomyces sp. NPDC058683]|uniref:MJ0042-type zinc finger domain-containing protein n=1 Tax=Streptomyces sp. NPDC058683 TaxID=3346597 RepID=UPI0036678EAE
MGGCGGSFEVEREGLGIGGRSGAGVVRCGRCGQSSTAADGAGHPADVGVGRPTGIGAGRLPGEEGEEFGGQAEIQGVLAVPGVLGGT